jgi:MFS family permease
VTASAAKPEEKPQTTPNGWQHRDFLLLWGGQTVSELGSSVTQLALPLTAVVLLQASTLEVGLLTAATTLAFALIALPAGAIVDRHAKRRLMIACDLARLVIIGAVPVAWAAGVLALWQLYVVAVAAGVCTVFFDVAYQSYLPSLMASEHLIDANGKLQATAATAQLAGPGLGGGLVAAFGAAGAMTADAVSYAVSVATLLGIRHREPPAPAVPAGERQSLRADIAEGLAFVVRDPILRKVVACTGTANLFGSIAIAVDIVFLVRVLHVRPGYTGLVFAVGAIGGIVGGLLAGRLAKRVGSARIIWVSILLFGIPSVLPPLAEPGWRVAFVPLGFAFNYFSAVVYNVAQVSYRQAICPPRLLGRMNAATRWIVWGTMPLGGLLGGVFGTEIGIRPTIWIGVIGGWAAGLFVFFSPLRTMRDVPSVEPGLPAMEAEATQP